MDRSKLIQKSAYEWVIEPFGKMLVPAILFADDTLIDDMDDKVFDQITHVAALPGIVKAAYTMPDAHWGYGFPIGGVAAFDPEENGIISAGGVGFDISCGVRTLYTNLNKADIEAMQIPLADALFRAIPAGVGSEGHIKLDMREMNKMLEGGAEWAVHRGWGDKEDLWRIEDHGVAKHAKPEYVSEKAKIRQQTEMGTLGSGNHYLEVQYVESIFDEKAADALHLQKGDVVVSIHCGSRGLGHQIGTDFLREMVIVAQKHHISLPDRELACAPILSDIGQQYLGAMRAGINCALANRQILTHLVRETFARLSDQADIRILYDVSHNTCKEETFTVEGKKRKLFVHRKGATRAFGPHHPDLQDPFKGIGQPVLIGGSMGTSSYILLGTDQSQELSFSSSCHGAGRSLSRHQASKRWHGEQLISELKARNIIIRSISKRGVAEEAPGAYKDVDTVVDVAEKSGISKKVAKLLPMICVKG